MKGTLMEKAAVQKGIGEKLKAKGMTLEQGGCAQAGYKDKYNGWHKSIDGIKITVWMR